MNYEEYTNEAVKLRPELISMARRYLGSDDDAEDAVQEVLLKLWLIHDTFVGNTQRMAHRMLSNHCISLLRRRKPSVSIDDVEWDMANDVTTDTTATDMEADDLEEMLAVVGTLPDYQQTILRLRHIDGMSMDDIASLTGTSATNIRQTLSRARRKARKQYMMAHGWKIGGIVATVAVAFAIALWHDNRKMQMLEARYGGSYVIEGGKKSTDLRQIMPDVQQALLMADEAHANMEASTLIRQAEMEAMKYIDDPELRKELNITTSINTQ